jgi:UDP-N-acetylglucosamine pyrophosphorylase
MLRLSTRSVDQQILQHMIDTQAEFIMEVTDKTKADVKVTSISSKPLRQDK